MVNDDHIDRTEGVPGNESQGRLRVVAILAVAALARVATVCFAVTHPTADWPVGPGNEEAILARSLLSGHGLSSPFGGSTGPTAFVAPGYPIVVAGVFGIFGAHGTASIFAVLLLQVVFSVATIALLMHLARRIFDTRTATIAGVFWAVSIPMIWMPTIFWDTCLSTLMLLAIIAFALRCREMPSAAIWILMGAVTGVAGLINPSLLPAMMAVMGWCAYQQRAMAKLRWQPAAGLFVLLVVFAPWPARNLKVMHAFIPLRSNLGFELWDGNIPGGNGKFLEELHPFNNKAEFGRYSALGEVGYMREKTSMATAFIEADPWRFAGISLKRVWDFWLGLAQPKDKVSYLLALHPILTALGGAAGMWLLFKKNRAIAWLFLLPLLIFPLPYYVTHPDLRFRLLLDPLLAILGAYALSRLLALFTVESQPVGTASAPAALTV